MLVIVLWWSEAFQSIKVAKDFSWLSFKKKGSLCLTWAVFFWFISVWSSNVDDNPLLKKQLGRNKNKLRWDIYRPVYNTVQPKHKTHRAATTQQIVFNVCLLEVLVCLQPRTHRLTLGSVAAALRPLLVSGAVSKQGNETRSKFLIEFHAGLVALLWNACEPPLMMRSSSHSRDTVRMCGLYVCMCFSIN